VPLPGKSMNFSSQSGVIWCILSHMRYSEVPLEGKNKTLVKILVGRLHRTTPAGQILGGRDPCDPCGVDAYERDTARICCCGATAAERRPCSNRSISPARQAHSSKPAAMMGQTDKRTPDQYIDPASHTRRSAS